jgi:hypothetical protein
MKLSFSDIFDDVGSHLVPKKSIRIGALVMPEGHPIDPLDPQLGLPLDSWGNAQFEVQVDTDVITILRVINTE